MKLHSAVLSVKIATIFFNLPTAIAQTTCSPDPCATVQPTAFRSTDPLSGFGAPQNQNSLSPTTSRPVTQSESPEFRALPVQQDLLRAGIPATTEQTVNNNARAQSAEEQRAELERKEQETRLTHRDIQQGRQGLQGQQLERYMAGQAPRFEMSRADFMSNYNQFIRHLDRRQEEAVAARDNYAYNAMGNFAATMEMTKQFGQLAKTIDNLDSVSPNSRAESNLGVNTPPQVSLNTGALSFPSTASEEKNTRAGATTKSGEVNDLVATSDGRPSRESKFMAGIGEMKDADLDKAIGISSIVPKGFLDDLDKKLAGIQNEKELVDFLKKAGVDANIASLAGIKSLSEFGALANKAIEAKIEDGSSYSASGGASRSQGSAEEDFNPTDILLKLTQGMGRMEQVQDNSPKEKEFKGAREMLASNKDARLKLAAKEAGTAKIALNPADSRTPAQANCLPGENCAASRTPASSNSLSNLIFLAIGIAVSLGIIFWVRRNKNKQ